MFPDGPYALSFVSHLLFFPSHSVLPLMPAFSPELHNCAPAVTINRPLGTSAIWYLYLHSSTPHFILMIHSQATQNNYLLLIETVVKLKQLFRPVTSLADDCCHSLNKLKSAQVKTSPEMFGDSALYLDKCRVSCSQVMRKSDLLRYIPVLRKDTPCTIRIVSASGNVFGTSRANISYGSNSLSSTFIHLWTKSLCSLQACSKRELEAWFKTNAICLIKELFGKESWEALGWGDIWRLFGSVTHSYQCHHQR